MKQLREMNVVSIIDVLYDEYIEVEAVVSMIKWFKREIGWTNIDINGIPHRICTHTIQLEVDFIPSIEYEHNLNPPI